MSDKVEGVEVALVATDPEDGREFDVVSLELAQSIVDRLLGPGRKVEPASESPGDFLVEFTLEEWEELLANGFFGREDDEASLEAEAP